MRRILLLGLLFSILASITPLQGQLVQHHLRNPSFEGEPADATTPVGWIVSTPGTTPDILPGFWGVYQEANDGDTYIGLITRPDGSWEAIAQRLPVPLTVGDCYRFTIDLAHSRTYSGYNGVLKLRVYGGRHREDRSYLLYESPSIDHLHWETYPVDFRPDRSFQYLILEAFYSEEPFSFSGNILLDNLSALFPCPRA
ncbi:MAG: hypothetical protein AAF433_06855 [Bacteroidota bacterium]